MESNRPQREKWSMVAQNWSEVSWEQIASTLRDDYAEYMKQYRTNGGIRDRKYQFLQGSYLMFVKLNGDPAELERFKDDPYWHGFHQPPKTRNLMLSVLTYNMQSKHDEPIQTLNYKYAKVLMSLHNDGVAPDNVAQRLKSGGGIYVIYDRICKLDSLHKNGPLNERKRDGVDLTEDESPDADEDVYPNVDEEGEQAASEDGDTSDNAIVHRANPPTDDQRAPPPPAMQRATNNQSDEIKRENHLIIQSKQGRLNRVDLKRELIVEFHPEELDEILASGGGEIMFSVMPCDERGFRRVIGSIKRLFPGDEGSSRGDTGQAPAAA